MQGTISVLSFKGGAAEEWPACAPAPYAAVYQLRGDDDFDRLAAFDIEGDERRLTMAQDYAAAVARSGETVLLILSDESDPVDVYCPHVGADGRCPND